MNPYHNHSYPVYSSYMVSHWANAQITTTGLVIGAVMGAIAVVAALYFFYLEDVFHHSGMELQRRK